jgi:hypothetical protein
MAITGLQKRPCGQRGDQCLVPRGIQWRGELREPFGNCRGSRAGCCNLSMFAGDTPARGRTRRGEPAATAEASQSSALHGEQLRFNAVTKYAA